MTIFLLEFCPDYEFCQTEGKLS